MRAAAAGVLGLLAGAAMAAPVVSPWATEPSAVPTACASASLSGWYATADTGTDSVEIRDVRGGLRRVITRTEIAPLVSWMQLDAGADGPSGLAWSQSGRSLFILVHDDRPGPGGSRSDAVLRYDTVTGGLGVFAWANLSDASASAAHPSALHFRGRLYVGGENGVLEIHRAERNDTSSFSPVTVNLGAPIRGLAVDRGLGALYAATDSALWRSPLSANPPAFVGVGPLDNAVGLTHAPHFGGFANIGVYALDQGGTRLLHVPDIQAAGLLPYAPSTYLTTAEAWGDVSATACGRLLLSGSGGASIVSETADPRLDFEQWVADEFAQVVEFCKSLVSPDGEPAGWVIDADAAAGGSRFHPASPDGAGWVVLTLLMNDHLYGDAEARGLVRTILERYAGLAGDGIGPVRSADGLYLHWMDPQTGLTKAGWPVEYATLSTMKIVLAADRAKRFYAGDAAIAAAADAIISGVSGWGTYIQPGTDALFFVGAAGGGPVGGAAGGFHEGIIYIEQAAAFGGEDAALDRWLDRSRWPSATYAVGMPVTTNGWGVHLPAFVSLYSWVAQQPFRESGPWQTHIGNLLGSHGAWVDDAGPRYMTVFSAGTTRADWGGYHADSLSDHPGDVSTFPSLMAFSARGDTAPAVGAYHAYRVGARQSFAGGASLLYRRSNIDPGYTPNTAGLPDVALGALGLAELIEPGSVDAVLATAYGGAGCPADLAPPAGVLDLADISAFVNAFTTDGSAADLAEPFGVLDLGDVTAFVQSFVAGCP